MTNLHSVPFHVRAVRASGGDCSVFAAPPGNSATATAVTGTAAVSPPAAGPPPSTAAARASDEAAAPLATDQHQHSPQHNSVPLPSCVSPWRTRALAHCCSGTSVSSSSFDAASASLASSVVTRVASMSVTLAAGQSPAPPASDASSGGKSLPSPPARPPASHGTLARAPLISSPLAALECAIVATGATTVVGAGEVDSPTGGAGSAGSTSAEPQSAHPFCAESPVGSLHCDEESASLAAHTTAPPAAVSPIAMPATALSPPPQPEAPSAKHEEDGAEIQGGPTGDRESQHKWLITGLLTVGKPAAADSNQSDKEDVAGPAQQMPSCFRDAGAWVVTSVHISSTPLVAPTITDSAHPVDDGAALVREPARSPTAKGTNSAASHSPAVDAALVPQALPCHDHEGHVTTALHQTVTHGSLSDQHSAQGSTQPQGVVPAKGTSDADVASRECGSGTGKNSGDGIGEWQHAISHSVSADALVRANPAGMSGGDGVRADPTDSQTRPIGMSEPHSPPTALPTTAAAVVAAAAAASASGDAQVKDSGVRPADGLRGEADHGYSGPPEVIETLVVCAPATKATTADCLTGGLHTVDSNGSTDGTATSTQRTRLGGNSSSAGCHLAPVADSKVATLAAPPARSPKATQPQAQPQPQQTPHKASGIVTQMMRSPSMPVRAARGGKSRSGGGGSSSRGGDDGLSLSPSAHRDTGCQAASHAHPAKCASKLQQQQPPSPLDPPPLFLPAPSPTFSLAPSLAASPSVASPTTAASAPLLSPPPPPPPLLPAALCAPSSIRPRRERGAHGSGAHNPPHHPRGPPSHGHRRAQSLVMGSPKEICGEASHGRVASSNDGWMDLAEAHVAEGRPW